MVDLVPVVINEPQISRISSKVVKRIPSSNSDSGSSTAATASSFNLKGRGEWTSHMNAVCAYFKSFGTRPIRSSIALYVAGNPGGRHSSAFLISNSVLRVRRCSSWHCTHRNLSNQPFVSSQSLHSVAFSCQFPEKFCFKFRPVAKELFILFHAPVHMCRDVKLHIFIDVQKGFREKHVGGRDIVLWATSHQYFDVVRFYQISQGFTKFISI